MTKFVKKVNYVWEQRKLGEIADKAVDNRGKTPFISKEGTHPLLEVASLGSGAPDYSKVTKYLSDETFKTELRAYIKEGDILFSTVGSIGLVSFMDTNENAAIAQNIVAFSANESYDSKFLYAMLSTEENQYKAQRIVMGAVQPSIKVSQLVDVEYFVTENIAEQRKLGEYFLNLDHLITLHQRKICIFIKKMPIDWEQRKFSELVTIERGGSPRPIDKFITNDENGLNWVKIGDAPEQGNYITQTAEKIRPEGLSKTREVHPGDLILSNSMSFGRPYIMAIDGCIHDGWLAIRNTQKNFDLKFLCTLLGTDGMLNQYKAMAAGSTVNNLNKELVGGTTIAFPIMEEQIKIGEYFSNIDHLITLHHRECVILQKTKVNDWEQRKFGDFTWDAGKRNKEDLDLEPYAITNEHGFIRQCDAHDDFGYMKDTDRKAYNIVKPNSFAYNPARINVGSIGYYKGVENVIVSSLYEVFQTDNYVNDRFLWHWFKSDEFPRWIERLQEGSVRLYFYYDKLCECQLYMPSLEEQEKIASFLDNLDHLITLHHRKCVVLRKKKVNDWEQRKLWETCSRVQGNDGRMELPTLTISAANGWMKQEDRFSGNIAGKEHKNYTLLHKGELSYNHGNSKLAKYGTVFSLQTYEEALVPRVYHSFKVESGSADFIEYYFATKMPDRELRKLISSGARMDGLLNIGYNDFVGIKMMFPSTLEQDKIAEYFRVLDHLITLHHHEEFCTENVLIYIEINITIQIKEDIMAELESVIEQKLIDQLVYGDSQWTYRADLKTEEDLWNNFRYILEQNNKDRLNGEPLSDTEFEQVKNQLQFSSFYKAGEWLVGENGKVMVHVQRDTERLHLVVMNHEHIAGGSSVYEVINQYRALADEESQTKAQDRRFDVTLMINGLPMIHIELKNKQHSYMDGFWQIKKYIGEGKFTGIFSAVQMFVISNGVDTKYFSAASDTELNPKFISGWLDNENNPVPDYLDFAKSVLRIPEAHEMIARYTVLDEEAKRLILLRPYQIHAIEAIREASKTGKSGFVWHTTGSGKTLTSYKATRNLLMDIPSIDKAIFLIDRKDLDTQTSMAFQAYANNDLVDVDETDNVFDLKKKLKSDDRQMIVTTIQKLQRLITKKLAEGTPEYNKIKSLKIAFVVDECHRAVTPGTKRELERFFANSLWYGFTGTPRFAENPYPQLGDLPRTTEELYGERLHRYTIQNAIHDNAVLGFQVEHNGPKNMDDETDSSMYENETHMLRVLDVILNKSYHKLGFQNGKGKTYEGLLTTSSIELAQKYYELLKRVKNGETNLQIDEKVKQILPDFPKFAITYSVTENEEGSHLNQEKMKESIKDYNEMFGTKLDISQIQSYNANLNKRLARKEPKFQSRSEQLDLVIVVDRLLTGFDAPCMSTLFVDRQPMGPHDLIQAFSRTNRIFDKNKTYGQIVTFQAPKLFKECVDNAVKLYSAGSTEIALLAEWEEIEPAFRKALKALRVSAETPAEIPAMSEKEKVLFVKAFQNFDKLFAQLKSFTQYEDSMLTEYGISEDEYDDYAGHYLNVKEELKAGAEDAQSEMEEQPIDVDYELMAYSNTKIDYEYIINLIQNIVTPDEDVEMTPEERQKQLEEVKQYIDDLRKENPKVADIMSTLVSEIEQDEVKYKGQSILNIVENMKHECIEKVVMDFSITWYVSKDDVMYAATHYRNGEIPNESAIKSTADFTSFKEAQERAIPKFKYYNMMIEELRKTLEEEIKPLLNN